MLDQTFSTDNFKRIADVENRKGFNVGSAFFPAVKAATDEIKSKVADIRAFRKIAVAPYDESTQSQYDALLSEKREKKKIRDQLLRQELSQVAEVVCAPSFSIDYDRTIGPQGKPIYMLDDSAAAHFAIKVLSRNISRLYKVKQANKNLICSQLLSILDDSFPYQVIRLDISQFYESIDQSDLLQKLIDDQLLSSTSIRLIRSILRRYSSLSGTTGKGLPRGIGISAYLSELYLRDMDRLIRTGDDVVYYARYVDDIAVVFAPSKASKVSSYRPWLEKAVADQKLSVNPDPAKNHEFSNSDANWKFEYLGYEFSTAAQKTKVRLSTKKFAKYEVRLKRCFDQYSYDERSDSKKAYRRLIQRMKFLTGNTQLSYSKSNAYVGIYYANPLLNDLSQLKTLDYKKAQLSKAANISSSLKSKLDRLSFEKGFHQQTFFSFGKKLPFTEIVSAWKHVT